MAGHLFITAGNLNTLRCDGVLLPSGTDPARPDSSRRGHVLDHWDLASREGVEKRLDGSWWVRGWPEGADLVALSSVKGGPEIWVAHTSIDAGSLEGKAVELGELVGAFVAEAVDVDPDRSGRSRALLAFPFLGAGAGGWSEKGAVIKALITKALEALAVPSCGVDLAFVAADRESFEAAQHVRNRRAAQPGPEVLRLARLARSKRLVLFLGAGASSASGLPDWSGLLTKLENEPPGGPSNALDYLDRAELISKRLGQEQLITQLAAELGGDHRLSLLHLLLASLPISEVATTNYDDLFDRAWLDAIVGPREARERRYELAPDIAELPGDDAVHADRWILKLHGSLKGDPERIVLSRGDYIRFERDAGALAGLVQAMLLTRHILFVGYSLSDPNFHRIVSDVRAAVGSSRRGSRQGYGTVLTPSDPGLKRELWDKEIDFLSTEVAEGPAESRRQVEIALDELIAVATEPIAFLTNKKYASLLDEHESNVADALSELGRSLEGAPPRLREVLKDIPGLRSPSRLASESSAPSLPDSR